MAKITPFFKKYAKDIKPPKIENAKEREKRIKAKLAAMKRCAKGK